MEGRGLVETECTLHLNVVDTAEHEARIHARESVVVRSFHAVRIGDTDRRLFADIPFHSEDIEDRVVAGAFEIGIYGR